MSDDMCWLFLEIAVAAAWFFCQQRGGVEFHETHPLLLICCRQLKCQPILCFNTKDISYKFVCTIYHFCIYQPLSLFFSKLSQRCWDHFQMVFQPTSPQNPGHKCWALMICQGPLAIWAAVSAKWMEFIYGRSFLDRIFGHLRFGLGFPQVVGVFMAVPRDIKKPDFGSSKGRNVQLRCWDLQLWCTRKDWKKNVIKPEFRKKTKTPVFIWKIHLPSVYHLYFYTPEI